MLSTIVVTEKNLLIRLHTWFLKLDQTAWSDQVNGELVNSPVFKDQNSRNLFFGYEHSNRGQTVQFAKPDTGSKIFYP